MPRFALSSLLAAGLCLTASFTFAAPSLAPALLKDGSHPPAFTLPDSAGNPVHLSALLGRKRIILVFLPGLEDAEGQKYLEMMVREHASLEARDLVVLAVTPPKSNLSHLRVSPPVIVLRDNAGKVTRAYGASGRTPVSYLIGKDGGVKIAHTGFLSVRELYGVIDAMPMRREEMRRRGR